MTSAKMSLRSLSRVTKDDIEEKLEFSPGVNVLVGLPNSGKTKWLIFLDYLFGDDGTIAKAVGSKLASLYKSARAELLINHEIVILERHWGPGTFTTKIYVNGLAVDQSEFSDDFLRRLNLPVIRFPKGNPYSQRKWPRLSWRILYRHIYRHETSWNEIAAKQPEGEQVAAMLLFLGVAERVFPPEYGLLVERQRELDRLEARHEQFLETLEEIGRELVTISEASVALTADSLNITLTRLQVEIAACETQREVLLRDLRGKAEVALEQEHQDSKEEFAKLGDQLNAFRLQRENLQKLSTEATQRRSELEKHRKVVIEELHKLERAQVAHGIFAALRITHCPNCDQAIERTVASNICKLCLQPYEEDGSNIQAANQRVVFEIQQLRSELEELNQLLKDVEQDIKSHYETIAQLDDRISQITLLLRPIHSATAWIIPPELTSLQERRGRLIEQSHQVERIKHALSLQAELLQKIDVLRAEIEQLRSDVKKQIASVEYRTMASKLAGGMNDYLNALNSEGIRRWNGGRVSVKLDEKSVHMTLGGNDWDSEIGGTNTCYFLASYNYSLLKLSMIESSNYPGFAVIDLPPNISDNRILTDEENYFVEPFIQLLNRPEMRDTQLIITGHAYEGLKGAHRIELNTIYEVEDTEQTD